MIKGPITFKFEKLVERKDSGLVPEAALAAFKKKADKLLDEPMLCVTDKKLKAPSGNVHEYMSCGLYWWPNPDTPNGLPYVNRDGVPNPDSNDRNSPRRLFYKIKDLALAELYFGGGAYAACAERQLYDWFLNPETYMEPNARYAQAIPGYCEGRSTGLIDFAVSYMLFDGVGILECLGKISEDIVLGVKNWFSRFADWMLTHENGIGMGNADNNIGVWHDLQILAMAVFCDRQQLVKNICTTAYRRRFLTVVKPDGSQPTELDRSKPMHYSIFTLDALMGIANIASRLGYPEYWGVDGVRGKNVITSAVDFIYPCIKHPESSPYSDLLNGKYGPSLAHLLYRVALRTGDMKYRELADEFGVTDAQWLLEPMP